VTLPEAAAARPPRWHATRYWRVVVLAELLAVAGLAACVLLLANRKAPGDLPLLGPDVGGVAPALAIPGASLTLRWNAGLESAGGHFCVEGQNVTMAAAGDQFGLSDVAVRQKRWSYHVFQPGQTPAASPIILEFQVRLPDDPVLEGEPATLRIAGNLEYPGWPRPGGPVSLQRSAVEREWTFTVATRGQQAAFARYLRGSDWLRAGIVACAVLILAIGFAAGLFAHRHLSVQCPKCSRITICTYYLGGRRLSMSPCPHHGTRPVESRGG